MRTEEIKNNIKKIYQSYGRAYEIASEQSYQNRLYMLKPGETAPAKGGFFSEGDRSNFNIQATEYRDKALNEINRLISAVIAKKTEAPSEDALRYVTLLRDQKNITEDDIDNALSAYGKNYAVYTAIRDIAQDRNIHGFRDNPIDVLADNASIVRENIEQRIGVYSAEHGQASPGAIAMLEMQVDSIPDMTL